MVNTTRVRKEIVKVSKAMKRIGFKEVEISKYWIDTLRELEANHYEN